MSKAKALVLPLVAVVAISLFSKAQNDGPKDQPISAAPSAVANAWTPEFSDLPPYNTTRQCAEMLNAGLQSIGKEDEQPRKVHFEFTLTLPANK